jgi:hypothetical protein
MRTTIFLKSVITVIFLSLMGVTAGAEEMELPGLDVYVIL